MRRTEPAGDGPKDVSPRAATGIYRAVSLVLQACTLGLGPFVIWQVKTVAHDAIAKDPAVLASAAAAAAASVEAANALAAAKDAGTKAEAAAATETRIFEVLKAQSSDVGSIKVSVGALAQQVTDVQSQVNRIETRQTEVSR